MDPNQIFLEIEFNGNDEESDELNENSSLDVDDGGEGHEQLPEPNSPASSDADSVEIQIESGGEDDEQAEEEDAESGDENVPSPEEDSSSSSSSSDESVTESVASATQTVSNMNEFAGGIIRNQFPQLDFSNINPHEVERRIIRARSGAPRVNPGIYLGNVQANSLDELERIIFGGERPPGIPTIHIIENSDSNDGDSQGPPVHSHGLLESGMRLNEMIHSRNRRDMAHTSRVEDEVTEAYIARMLREENERVNARPEPAPKRLKTERFGELRKFSRIPIFVVDYHNDVIRFIQRCIGSRHLPLKDNILVHFDSHPDMVMSRDVPASWSFIKDKLEDNISIENWIMPLVYAGHFNRVVWVKNNWCDQIPLGTYDFKIGEKEDMIYGDLPLGYFLSEGNYCKTEELENVKDLHFEVHNLDEHELDPKKFLSVDDIHNFILDIDLDFFSTANPFLQVYKNASCYEHLKNIFDYAWSGDDVTNDAAVRIQQIRQLKAIFVELQETGVADYEKATALTDSVKNRIKTLVDDLRTHYNDAEIDWIQIFNSGCTADANGLPHHISTPAELELYYARFEAFLRKLPIPPIAVTIACSAEDEYCPPKQVGKITSHVISILRKVFEDQLTNDPILYHLGDEWNLRDM